MIPFFIFKIIFPLFWKNSQFKIEHDNSKLENLYDGTILIWLDYSNAIGDFFAILKVLIEFDKLNKKYTLMVSKKFAKIIENLNFKNANIIYKNNSLGTHYKNNDCINKSICSIDEEFINKKLIFDKIYYFNGVLLADALLAIKNIRYNKIYMFDPKIFLRGRHSKFIDRNHIKLSFFFLINKEKFPMEIIQNKEYKNQSISQIVSHFLGIKFDQHIENDNIKNNENILISAGASNASKVLHEYKMEEILNSIDNKKNKIFVGSPHDNQFITNFIKSNKYKFSFDLTIFELFNLVKESNMIITYDTGLYHIAKFWEKNILLILNKNDFAYKYMRNYWIGNQMPNEKRIILKSNNFNN